MNDTLFDMTSYKSEAVRSYSPDWTDATGSDPSWDVLESAQDLETSTDSETTNTPTGWRSAAEFTIILKSGLSIDVKFVPGIQGELSMHQFDFTGLVSPTGNKSHLILAVESESGWATPADYAQAYAQGLVAQLKSKKHSCLNKKRSRSVATAQAPQGHTTDKDNSTIEPTMAENETTDSSHAPVEVVEELSPEEEADRQRLELKVERAWDEAARALRELRDRRLYRSQYKTFEEYCRDRFGFTRQSANFKIAAADVMENLTTKSCQILPTKETQVRPLTKLKPDEQPQVWQEAVKQNGGKVPSERVVKDAVWRHLGIVEHFKQKNPLPPEFALGDVIEIKAVKRSPLHPFDGMWGIIEYIGSFSYTVRLGIARDTQQCKGEEMTRIDDEYTADIKVVSQRLAALVQFELEPVEYALLEFLQRSKCFTPTQLQLLEWLEQKHLDA